MSKPVKTKDLPIALKGPPTKAHVRSEKRKQPQHYKDSIASDLAQMETRGVDAVDIIEGMSGIKCASGDATSKDAKSHPIEQTDSHSLNKSKAVKSKVKKGMFTYKTYTLSKN